MSEIIIPKFVEAKAFFDVSLYQALANCQSEGFTAQFIPEIIDSRTISYKTNDVWRNWYNTSSIRATGTTKNGSKVVVYAHVPNTYSNPREIKTALKNLRDGAGALSAKEFNRLVSLEDGERVFVLDYDATRKAKSGQMSLNEARKNIHTKAFIGGEARMDRYLIKHREVIGDSIYVYYSDDMMDTIPRARMLSVDDRNYNYFLCGHILLDGSGRFLGLRDATGVQQKISPLETLAGKGRDVGNGIIVMNKKNISTEAYNVITGKYTSKNYPENDNNFHQKNC